MLPVNKMSKYQAFRWLWRFDSEARYFWLWCYLKSLFNGTHLKDDVAINLRDFGVCK